MKSRWVVATLLGLSTSIPAVVSAQTARTWVLRDGGGPGPLDLASEAWDPVNKRVLLFAGRSANKGTYAWSGSRWERVSGPESGPRGYDVAAAADEGRGVIVAFGGAEADHTTATLYRDVYEWNGSAWSVRTTTTKPPARRAAAMAYHPGRKTVILFGGRDNSSRTFSDMWEWNGTTWAEVPSGTATGFSGGLMAFDRKANELILLSAGTTRAWNGTAWQERATGGPAEATAIGWDNANARLVAQGYSSTSGPMTWVWSGTSWDALATTGGTPGRPQARQLVFDEKSASLVMFSNTATPSMGSFDEPEEATFTLAGSAWTRAPNVVPTWRTSPGVAFDELRGRLVMFGGARYSTELAETWEWDGERWYAIATATAPSPRNNPAMAWDPSRGAIVLYGGSGDGGGPIGETWTWNGTEWTKLTTATTPPLRYDTTLAWDGAGILMFGGAGSGSAYLNDTWRLTGSDWAQLTPTTSPPGRSEHAMAYDADRKRVVLYSGRNSSSGSSISDTWEFDGTNYRAVGGGGVGNRLRHAMVWMPPLKTTLLFGASSGNGSAAEWNGLLWEPITTRGQGAPATNFVKLVWDTKRNRAVAVGAGADLWDYVAIGNTCTAASECTSGHCVDGVCCDRACAGGVAGDCLACSKKAGGVEDGVCGPLADKDAACVPVADGGIDSDASVPPPGASNGSSDGGCGCSLVPSTFGAVPFASALLALIVRQRRRRSR